MKEKGRKLGLKYPLRAVQEACLDLNGYEVMLNALIAAAQ